MDPTTTLLPYDTENSTIFDCDSNDTMELSSDSLAIALHLVQKLVCVFSLVSNILVIIVVLGDRKTHTTANLLIANLAVAQIMLLTVRLHIIPMVAEDVTMSSVTCKLSRGGMHWSQAATALTICLISLERRRATKSLSRSSNVPQHQLAIVVALLWILTLGASLRSFIVTDIVIHPCGPDPTKGFCYPDMKPYYKLYTYLFHLLFYLLPLIIMSVGYGCVIRSLRYKSNGTTLQPSQVQRMIATRRRVSITVFLISAAFCILWFPHVFLQICWYVNGFSLGISLEERLYVIIVTEILIEFQGCVNVLTLCFLSQSFRQSLVFYLRFVYNCVFKCRCGCANDNNKPKVFVDRNEHKSNSDPRITTRSTHVTSSHV